MGKTNGTKRNRSHQGENLNLRREIQRDLRDADNMVARAIRAQSNQKSTGDIFSSLKVFPPKWWDEFEVSRRA